MKPAVLLSMMRWRGGPEVARALLDAADVDLIAVAPCTSELEAAGIPHQDFMDYIPQDPAAAHMPGILDRLSRIMEVLQSDAFRDSYPRVDDAGWRRLQEALAEGLREQFVGAAFHLEALRCCATRNDLRLLVVSEDNITHSRAVVLTADRLGIPSLHIPHGATGGAVTPHPCMAATYIAAHSEHMRRQYEQLGAAPDRIVVTGNPAWDRLCRPSAAGLRSGLCRDAELDPDRPLINYAMTDSRVFASSCLQPGFANHHTRYVEAVLDAYAALAPRHPEWQFGIRPRPGDDTDPPLQVLMQRYAGRLQSVLIDRHDPHDSLAMTDLLLATQSNMGIEAILMGTPHIDVNIDAFSMAAFNDEGLGPLFDAECDAILTAREPDEIAPLIESALTDPATRERLLAARPFSIDRYNHRGDGKASERVRDLILSLLDAGHTAVPPMARYAVFESALVEAVPEDAATVSVLGAAACPVRDALSAARPDVGSAVSGPVDAVIVGDPLSPTPDTHALIEQAVDLLAEDGIVVAPVRNLRWRMDEAMFPGSTPVPGRAGFEPPSGVEGYTLGGVKILLSRLDLELSEARPVREPDALDGEPPGWVVTARRRTLGPSVDTELRRRREDAEGSNRRGEKRFANGDYAGAARDFSEATASDPDQPLFHNNLAAALHAADRPEQAWDALLNALHLDPRDENARANLEAIGEVLGRPAEAQRLLRIYGDAE
ncbi:MAG: glycosyltransferase [bacterium]|nr:glycosyltransferase [bacterium]